MLSRGIDREGIPDDWCCNVEAPPTENYYRINDDNLPSKGTWSVSFEILVLPSLTLKRVKLEISNLVYNVTKVRTIQRDVVGVT